jgi:hypothetical protein
LKAVHDATSMKPGETTTHRDDPDASGAKRTNIYKINSPQLISLRSAVRERNLQKTGFTAMSEKSENLPTNTME